MNSTVESCNMVKREGNMAMTTLGPLSGTETVRLLVGPNKQEFTVHRKLLCASSSFFRYSLETGSSVPGSPESELPAASSLHHDRILWLSEECPAMMELFVLWLYQRNSFRTLVEQMIASVAVTPRPANKAKILAGRRTLHWNLVKLHLFAAAIRLPALQDIAIDAIQDMYLRCDWDVSLNFLRYLYEECTRGQSFRLRKWAVAMLAWTLGNGGGDPIAYNELLGDYTDLWEDYDKHMEKMNETKADVQLKNPQLRLPRNRLKNEERHFGFRQCSFHSHRSTVGEGRCPYAVEQLELLSSTQSFSPISPTTDKGFEDGENFGSGCVASKPPTRHTRLRSSGSAIKTLPDVAEET